MAYREASQADVAFFREHGWIAVEDVIPQSDLDELERRCDTLLEDKERYAFDWAWDAKEDRTTRSFRIVQSSPSLVWPEISDQPYRKWLVGFGSALMGVEVDFWYDQFLGKPPGKSVPTYWHQDEAYWSRNLRNAGITCWMPMIDVNEQNGCMHFVDGGHIGDVLPHRGVEGMQSDILVCEPDLAKALACPIKRGSVTFHHSNMPHMTTSNTSQNWRKAVTNHLKAKTVDSDGEHYPWREYVDQRTGERRKLR
jgi:hypothetical protein